MKRVASLLLLIVASYSMPAPIARADQPPLASTTFETDPGDWRVINLSGQPADAAKISITHTAADVKMGKGSLKLEYSVKKGDTNLLVLPFQPPSLVKMQSIHFWVKLDHAASVMLVMSEKDGDSYQETIACAANGWQEVSAALSDMVLNVDQSPAKDADGKLHTDRVDSIGLIDADCYLRELIGDVPFLNIASGSHTLYLNSFSINETPLPSALAAPSGELQLTPLIRPQVDWLVLGGMSVQKTSEKPLSGESIRANYTQTKGKVFGLLKSVKVGSFAGVTQLSLTAASTKPANLMVQIEQTNGDKFKTTIEIPGGSEVKTLSLKLADFTAASDSKDPNGKQDLELVKQLMILDMSGIADIQDTDNTLWINNVRAIKKP